jgi:23S rRNA (adenine1618-N6)-methyltransferase
VEKKAVLKCSDAKSKVKTKTKTQAMSKIKPKLTAKPQKNINADKKQKLHVRNVHGKGYPIDELVKKHPPLLPFVVEKPDGNQTINFSDPVAVKTLNAALLAYYYQVKFWDIPKGYLCPPIPGRADYVHYIADLLAGDTKDSIVNNYQIKGLDIGTGANCVYPILANRIYGWNMLATDIDPISVKSANTIVSSNPVLKEGINVRHQTNKLDIFKGVVNADEKFDFCMCNPPFHASAQEAQAGSQRKVKNLSKHSQKRQSAIANPSSQGMSKKQNQVLNFAGQANELWCDGGELAFVKRMIEQSQGFAKQIEWFTCLVSKKEHIPAIKQALDLLGCVEWKVVDMAQGQKISRFIAWRFLWAI